MFPLQILTNTGFNHGFKVHHVVHPPYAIVLLCHGVPLARRRLESVGWKS